MARRRVLKNKLVIYVLSALLVVMACFGVYNVLSSYFTLSSVTLEQWDGVSVSSSFSSGNGTEENPYTISSGEDLAYFKSLIEGLNYNTYNEQYYVLTNDIDLGDHEFGAIGIIENDVEKLFKGHFDGNGYTIKNAQIAGNNVDNYSMYGLFTILDGATISNLNLENIDLVLDDSSLPYMAGTVAGEVRTLSTIYNVSVYDGDINLGNSKENSDSKIAGLIGRVSSEVTIKNIYLNTELTSDYSSGIAKIFYSLDSNVTNIVSYVETGSLLADTALDFAVSSNDSSISNLYYATLSSGNLKVTLDGKSVSSDTIATIFDEGITGDFFWGEESGTLKLCRVEVVDDVMVPTAFSFGSSVITLHDTGYDADAGIVYLNDLTSDYDYYMGLNYTNGTNSNSVPDGTNSNKYTDSNLVKTYIQYNGSDPDLSDLSDDSTIGHVSNTEQYSIFNYYKYYYVENGYITIELIDNPYADRPDDKAFGGWITDYENAYIWYDADVHVYYAKVPVSDVSSIVNIVFYARWVPAKTYTITNNDNNTWTNAFAELDTRGFNEFEATCVLDVGDISGYYLEQTLASGKALPTDQAFYYYDYATGNFTYAPSGSKMKCNYAGGAAKISETNTKCIYYIANGDTEFNKETTYYEYDSSNNVMVEVEIGYTCESGGTIVNGGSAAGLYVKTIITNGSTTTKDYYDGTGNLVSSGTKCSTSAGCTYYDLLQYTDSNGNQNIVDLTENTYYWLVTRDTNIVVLNTTISKPFTNTNIPFTLTGINNGNTYNGTYNLYSSSSSGWPFGQGSSSNEGYISIADDFRMEFITTTNNKAAADETPSVTSGFFSTSIKSGVILGNYNNLKIGRGINRNGTYQNANSVVGGSTSAPSNNSASNLAEYHLIVESGFYNNFSVTNAYSSSVNLYANATGIYGSDFDRAFDINNLLDVYCTAAGAWGGSIRSSNSSGTSVITIVKSGTYGSKHDYYTDGIYVGSLNGGTNYARRSIVVEGGKIYNIIGGPLSDSSLTNVNDIYINVKGGTIEYVFGGAGRSTTYGNKILNIVGGTVTNAVFGGSNGYKGNTSEGVITGSSFVYIGGHAKVGSNDLSVSPGEIYDEDSGGYGEVVGSIYGIGNGKSDVANIGTMSSSNVVIDGSCEILGNVFGGGNYGGVGTSLKSGNANTKIKILGGTVNGSVYGGGNNNGSGVGSSSDIDVTGDIYIDMTGGTVGNVYGGSKATGVIYGDSNINILGGTVTGSVYGGGEGGWLNEDELGTYVAENSIVKIGRDLSVSGNTELDLRIDGNVYGGSAYGTVNGSTYNASATSTYKTTVDVYYGVITGSVFGGGKGDTSYKPKVLGDAIVNIYGGNIGNVFGGNDASGSPSREDYVYLNGGTIGNAFGGGNSTGQTTTNIYLQGSNVSNLYGGSNLNGVVTTTNVTVTSGTVGNIYGGNNRGESTGTTNVSVTSAIINGDIYGGGNAAPITTKTNLVVENVTVNDVYGGSQESAAAETSVQISNTTGNSVFGGSNKDGLVGTTSVTIDGNKFYSVYGGNNEGGTTSNAFVEINSGSILDENYVEGSVDSEGNTIIDNSGVYGGSYGAQAISDVSKVVINGGTISNVFGGGNNSGLTTSDVNVVAGTIKNVYGGSNKSGDVTTSNVLVGGEPVQYIGISVTGNNAWEANGGVTRGFNIVLTNSSSVPCDDWEIKLYADMNILSENNWNYVSEVNNREITIYSTSLYNNGSKVAIPANGSLIITPQVTFNYSGFTYDMDLSVFDLTGEIIKPEPQVSNDSLSVTSIYGGNNIGGTTSSTNVLVNSGTIVDIFGGGNKAPAGTTKVEVNYANVTNMYGGGNYANVTGDTYLDLNSCTFETNVYGGGNQGSVLGKTEVYVTDSVIKGNVYAGGNAGPVSGNTTVSIDGDTVVGTESAVVPDAGCVFGGGKSATTGSAEATATASVNITGGYIYGNVYGGASFSTVYGATVTNIGSEAVNNSDLRQSDIVILGTVFGGGENDGSTGEDGSDDESFKWEFDSVIGTININVDGTGYVDYGDKFTLSGSIFGSGNASNSTGTSEIYIKKLGTKSNPSRNISIQRTGTLTIDNSYIELSGIEDRTNDFATTKYSFNRIDKLVIKNNTTLFLRKNANLLKEIYSGVDVDGKLVPAVVEIDDDTKTVEKNVDNRIYMIPLNSLNIWTTQNVDDPGLGPVTGMTFFGMYNVSSDGSISYGLYNPDYNYGSATSAGELLVGSSYVYGLHKENHDITVDGFYTNVFNDEMTEVITQYIDPIPPDKTFYRWIIGIETINYSVDLIASKYSSLGTAALSMVDFVDGNTQFEILGFSSEGLNSGMSLVDPDNIKKVASTEDEANTTFGLAMKSETREWTSYNTTEYTDTNGGTYTGDYFYQTDSQTVIPTMMFYLYHSKNVTADSDVGSVLITLMSATPLNEIEYEYNYVTITVNIVTRNYDNGNEYDASITYDKKYEMPAVTSVNITNQSQFTAYFSLYAQDELKNIYGTNYQNYHVLVSNYALPLGTQITMIDYGSDEPQYYYFDITEDVYNDSLEQLNNDNEITYRISDFVRMGSINGENTYDEVAANKEYYDTTNSIAMEEFIFIVDMKETITTGTHEGNTLLFELRDEDDVELYSVLGIRRGLMTYNLYDSSNVVLQEKVEAESEYLYYDIPAKFNFQSIVAYDYNQNGAAIIDTNYESSSMGLNVFFTDKEGNQISSTSLAGTVISIDGKSNFVDADGVFRIKLSGKVSNLTRTISLLVDGQLPEDIYTISFILFASDDGLHNSSLNSSAIVEIEETVVGDDNAILVTEDDKTKVVDGDTGLNQLGTRINTYTLEFHSVLKNPNVRVELYKRDTSDSTTIEYQAVNFDTLFTNKLASTSYESNYLYEKELSAEENDVTKFDFELQENLTSGTYKLVFRLYDGTQLIEEEYEYIIVTKDIVNKS